MIFIIPIVVGLSVFLGGVFAFKHKDRLHLILSFSAGLIIATALLHLIPESVEILEGIMDIHYVMIFSAIGFILFFLLDRLMPFHSHDYNEKIENADCCEHNPIKGNFASVGIILHSLIDGIALGISFSVSISLGITVSIAVLAHSFADGINNVSSVLRYNKEKQYILKWLLVGSVAPIIGFISGSLLGFNESMLAIMLSIFSGFFIYLGASDLLPEIHHKHPQRMTVLITVLGFATSFLLSLFAH